MLSFSLNTYVPAGSTWPVSSNGWLNVRIVCLSQSSARALDAETRPNRESVKPIQTACLNIHPSLSEQRWNGHHDSEVRNEAADTYDCRRRRGPRRVPDRTPRTRITSRLAVALP